jgi:hypothetical protein
MRTKLQRVSARVQAASGVLVLVLVTVTGHYGGKLTHGDTYLVEHAPAFIRSFAGLAPARGKITDLAVANPFLDIVQPIFNERCAGCHNESKRRGGLSLASFASLTKGGKDGPVVAPGKPQESDLVRRISLPHDDKDAMPAEGKTPLTADQVEMIRWWIAQGARADTTLASVKLTPELKLKLTSALGIGGAESSATASSSDSAARPDVKADAKTVDALVQAGFQVRPVSRSDPRLVVSGVGMRNIGSAQLHTLSSAHTQIADLSLWQLGLRDADLEPLSSLTELTRLNLSGNQLSDTGVRLLAKMPKLEVLNLYGNDEITDESVAVLAQLPALRKLYLWNTRIDPAQVRMLTERHPGLIVDLGDGAAPVDSKQITAP